MGEFKKGFKGFRHGLRCLNKHYAENTIFEEESAKICESGMHFCENPCDVLDYYGFVDNAGAFTEFAECEALAKCETNDSKKYCTTKLKIGRKLPFHEFVKACVEFIIEKTKDGYTDNENRLRVGSSGDAAKLCSSMDHAQIGSYMGSNNIGSSGNSTQIGSSGDFVRIASSGWSDKILSYGKNASIVSSGDSARIGSSGDYARIGSSGVASDIASYGVSAKISSSGDFAKIISTGADSVICCAGNTSIVMAKKGSWITLAEWVYSEEKGRYVPNCVKTEFVDGERIKADAFYILKDGEFVECLP